MVDAPRIKLVIKVLRLIFKGKIIFLQKILQYFFKTNNWPELQFSPLDKRVSPALIIFCEPDRTGGNIILVNLPPHHTPRPAWRVINITAAVLSSFK